MKRFIILLLLIIVAQAIFNYFEKRKLEKLLTGHLDSQRRELSRKINSIKASNSRLYEISGVLLQRIEKSRDTTIIINRTINEKKQRINSTFSSDSL